MKKILSLVLAMLMIFSMVPAVFAAETSESDYQAAIEYLKAIDVYKGTSEGDAADELVERNQMALFTARMVTGRTDDAYWETDANDSGFTDVDALRADVLGAVCYAAQQGIVNGIGGGEFAPYDNVTYRDAIVMIVRALGFNYPDSGYPWSYINKARELRVLDGITGVSYTAEVKREVIAQLLYNAINAEIKGETIAASVFGVEETIVMVTATPDGIVYKKDGKESVKANMVRVSAVDANGDPIGTEYYVPFKALGLKNDAAANVAVGTYFKLTHKGNFSNFLASESLTQVFENTPDKKEVKYTSSNGTLALGKDSYKTIGVNAEYSTLTNNQGTFSGMNEIKVFKAFGAKTADAEVGKEGYFKGVDGKVYTYANPFVPFAIYSDIAKAWFHVSIDQHGVTRYNKLSDADVATMLEKIDGSDIKGFSGLNLVTGKDAYYDLDTYGLTKMDPRFGVEYDYYKAFASDVDGDGLFERVTVRQYQMFWFEKDTRKGLNDENKTTDIDTFKLTAFLPNGLTMDEKNYQELGVVGDAEYSYDYNKEGMSYKFFRFTGVAYNKLPAKGIIIAYLNTGVDSEQEIEIVDVADKMSAYVRGYDQASDSIIYGSDYATMKFGYVGVYHPAIYRATDCYADSVGTWKVNSANYIRQFWNEYVDMYVLNDSVVYIDNNNDADDYVILESITGFSDEGLTAIAYSTKAGGKTEILINELNGWHLAGFDYDLYEEMIRLQALLGDKYKLEIPPMPVELNKVYAVRYVNEDGAYNLINPLNTYDKEIYVNNYGYIIGVDKDGVFAPGNRVATSDKDLWFIYAQDEKKVYPFQGKLASIYLTGTFYKAKNNQFVLEIADADQLKGILGDSMEGYDYYLYNKKIDNEYKNANFFGSYVYGHAMQNIRTGKVDFITYDPVLAAKLNKDGKWYEGQYIGVRDGAIFQTVSGVLKEVEGIHTLADVAKLEFNKGAYEKNSFAKVAVGAVVPAGVDLKLIPGNVNAAYSNYGDLVEVSGFNKKIPAKGSLVDVITDTLYEGVYGSDFDKGHVSYENAIRLELAHKVTFISLEADGTRTAWTAAKDNAYQAKTLGNANDVVYAYVMYDFANAKATVFVDNAHPKTLTSNDSTPVSGFVAGVDATFTFDSNVMKGQTNVTIVLSKPVLDLDVKLDGVALPAGALVTSSRVTFTVNEAEFKDVSRITATGTKVVTKITGVIATDDTLGMANEAVCDVCGTDGYAKYTDANGTDNLVNATVAAGYAPLNSLFDGTVASAAGAQLDSDRIDPLTTVKLTGSSLCHKHDYTTFKRADHVKKGTPEGTAGFNAAVIAELPAAQTVNFARVYIPDNKTTASHFAVVNKAYAIMASSDGINWKLVNTIEKLWEKPDDYVNKGVIVVPGTEDYNGYLYVDFELTGVPADTKYVAVGWTEISGWGQGYSANNWQLSEIEFYK